jgi:two-component system, OmpR family, phosphate regulon sensor histidine kinase PhoR
MDELGDGLLRLAMRHSPVGMMLVSPEGRLLAVNDAMCRMLGREHDELLERTWQDITHPDDLAIDTDLTEAVLAGERSSYRLTKRYLRNDGQLVWGDLSVALLRDDDGAPLHFIAQIVDMTDQREAAQRIADANALIDKQARAVAAIYDAVDVGLVLIDRSGRYEQLNRRHRDFMALAYPEGHHGMAGQTGEVFEVDGETRMARQDLPSARAVAGDEFDDVRLWVGTDPATRRALSVSARSTRHPDGTLAGAALAYKDVTDFMRALSVKDEFVASVSHELRTPLTSVLGHLEMLEQREDLPADVRAQLAVVDRNAARLQMLVSDLLYVAQEADASLQVVRVAADAVTVVREAVEAALPQAAAAGVDLAADLPDAFVAMFDPQRLRQVVDNLVSNGIKYTDRGGEVRVSLPDLVDRLEVRVSDTGIGIAPEDQARLFSRFYRADVERVRITPGTGLGLSIVRSIAEGCGGGVEVESTVGVGSTITAWIPRVAADDE